MIIHIQYTANHIVRVSRYVVNIYVVLLFRFVRLVFVFMVVVVRMGVRNNALFRFLCFQRLG